MERSRCRGCERGIRKPAEEVVTGAGCRRDCDIRVLDRVARNRIRVHSRVTCRGAVIQRPLHGIGLCGAPLCVNGVVRCARRVNGSDRRRECCVRIPALEIVTRAGRLLQCDDRIRDLEAARICRVIGRGMACRYRVVHHIGDCVRQRRTPLCVQLRRVRIALRRVEGCRSRGRITCIRIPAKEGVAWAGRVAEGVIRGLHGIGREAGIRVRSRVSCRGAVVQIIANRIGLPRPLCIVVAVSRRILARCELGLRCARESRVIIPAAKGVARPGRRRKGDIRICDLVVRSRVRIHCKARRAGTRRDVHVVVDVILVFDPVCGHRNHTVILRREQIRCRAVRISLAVRTGPAVKGVTVHGKVVREVCGSRAAGNRLIRHGARRGLACRRIRDKLDRIVVRISCHRARDIGNRISTDCRAARRAVVKGCRRKRRRRARRRHRDRLAVVKVHGDARHAVVADETGHRHIGRIPGQGLGRRHGARIHGNRERHIDRAAARIAERAVCPLCHKRAACSHIDCAAVRDTLASRNAERMRARVDHNASRNIGGHCRIVGQRDRRIAVLVRPGNRVVEVTEVLSLTVHNHIGDIARDERNRLVNRRASLLISTELDEEALYIVRRIIIAG